MKVTCLVGFKDEMLDSHVFNGDGAFTMKPAV
jgi:hypothetical protein